MGRVARAKSHKTRNRAHGLTNTALCLLILCFCVSPAWSQSGRRQEPGKTTKPAPGPIADPNRPGSSNFPAKTTKPSTDEVDSNDVVRISSNLVPIPVSVVDKRGNAIVNLKLDDFELRVDGEPRPLSDLTRSETSVRLAMLFDNSGSLDAAREFEKQAAMRFFRKVVRVKKQTANFFKRKENFPGQTLKKKPVCLEQ